MVGISILKHSVLNFWSTLKPMNAKKVFLIVHPYPIVSVTCRSFYMYVDRKERLILERIVMELFF